MQKPEDTTTAGPLALSLHAGLGLAPVAWAVSGATLTRSDGAEALWTREPTEDEREMWQSLGVQATVTALYPQAALVAERERARVVADALQECLTVLQTLQCEDFEDGGAALKHMIDRSALLVWEVKRPNGPVVLAPTAREERR